MSSKKRIATAWLQGCSGCHMSFLDLHGELLDVFELVDLLASPIMDIKEMPEVDILLVEGAVANTENAEVLRHIRKKAKTLVAFGTCAAFGGIAGLRNLFQPREVLQEAYVDAPSVGEGLIPGSPEIPKILPLVHPLSDIIQVDYVIPGCPPVPAMIKEVLVALIKGEEPKLGERSLCHECGRKQSEMLVPKREFVTDSVLALMECEEINEEKCFLEQGILCMGSATREGCYARCLKGNVPCRGCMGPAPGALEQGAKIINALASILPAGGLMFMEDIVGTSYRYSLPVSIIPAKRGSKDHE
ncbi:MAG TPA: F420-nonreducing hydrogenase [Bacillota bacterium]|nr:F420-nonreducing hydrogenase [Bacillota bacterium]